MNTNRNDSGDVDFVAVGTSGLEYSPDYRSVRWCGAIYRGLRSRHTRLLIVYAEASLTPNVELAASYVIGVVDGVSKPGEWRDAWRGFDARKARDGILEIVRRGVYRLRRRS